MLGVVFRLVVRHEPPDLAAEGSKDFRTLRDPQVHSKLFGPPRPPMTPRIGAAEPALPPGTEGAGHFDREVCHSRSPSPGGAQPRGRPRKGRATKSKAAERLFGSPSAHLRLTFGSPSAHLRLTFGSPS